jgi:ferredoxin
MKITIDRDACIMCGACEATCDQVFKLPQSDKSTIVEKYRINGRPEAGEIPKDLESCAQGSVDGCPVSAISAE